MSDEAACAGRRVGYQPDGTAAQTIQAGDHANIPPSMPHSIRPADAARFYVAFYSCDGI
ncbi:MAG: hypothetical protein Q9M16_00445 [Mariprofundus sp.]|nr:hypothetical protein [Mariprofundus sp.]